MIGQANAMPSLAATAGHRARSVASALRLAGETTYNSLPARRSWPAYDIEKGMPPLPPPLSPAPAW